MYVILTSKPGQFHTDLVDGLTAEETYRYLFCGRETARYVIAHLARELKVPVIEDTPPHITNHVPSKFLERFETLEAARQELQTLTRFGTLDARLERC